jgi:hypothetical protein
MLKTFKTYLAQVKAHKHLTPATVDSLRYYKRWKRTMTHGKSSLDYRLPWFTFQAIDKTDAYLEPGMKIFEFGGGGSTLFFLDRGCEVHTVEHHAQWFADIEKFVNKEPYKDKWHGYLLEPASGNIVPNPSFADPTHYHSKDADYQEVNFKAYASRIDTFANEHFDLVLVDGRVRPACVYHAVSKIKKGGYLVVDNTEREYYTDYFNRHFKQDFTLLLDVYGPVPYVDWFHKTTVWKKN